MELLKKIITGLKDIEAKTDEHILNVVNVEEDILLQSNKQQMFSGKTATGKEIRPPYTPVTVLIKQRKRQPYDRVTLSDTGDFYDSMRIEFNIDSFEIVADDHKTKDLKLKYSKEILGLNSKSKDYLKERIRIDFKNRILALW